MYGATMRGQSRLLHFAGRVVLGPGPRSAHFSMEAQFGDIGGDARRRGCPTPCHSGREAATRPAPRMRQSLSVASETSTGTLVAGASSIVVDLRTGNDVVLCRI